MRSVPPRALSEMVQSGVATPPPDPMRGPKPQENLIEGPPVKPSSWFFFIFKPKPHILERKGVNRRRRASHQIEEHRQDASFSGGRSDLESDHNDALIIETLRFLTGFL